VDWRAFAADQPTYPQYIAIDQFGETISCGKAFRLQYKWTLLDQPFNEK
jgi:hypothetical protein